MIEILKTQFNLDFWVFWGLTAQSFFFLRLFIQWFRSEQNKKIVVPLSFWWLGIIGAAMLLIYAYIRRDIVFILTSIIQLVVYYRNLTIALKADNENLPEQNLS